MSELGDDPSFETNSAAGHIQRVINAFSIASQELSGLSEDELPGVSERLKSPLTGLKSAEVLFWENVNHTIARERRHKQAEQ